MKMNGAQILVKCLEEQGVLHIFGYPGASILPVYAQLASSSIRHILTAHEQGACFAAEGYARAGGKTGVVLATSGPGATNLVTGIADAFMDSVPLVAITGNVPLQNLGHDSFQEVDIFGMTLPVTKYSMIVKSASELAESVRKAFRIASSGRKGPVLIDIPCNVFEEQADYNNVTPDKRPAADKNMPAPAKHEIARAAELINSSLRPVIYAGGGVIASGASKELGELVGKTCAPVTVSYMGIGCYDPDGTDYLGVLSDINKTAAAALRECDLLITVGARFNSRFASFSALKKRKIPVLQIDIDRAEFDKNLPAAASVTGDIKTALNALLPYINQNRNEEWVFRDFPEFEVSNRGIDIIKCLNGIIDPDWIVATDVGLHQEWAAHNLKIHRPAHFLTSGGLGAMGFSVGAAIGAHMATGRKVLAVTGDGSFNMNFNEMSTAIKNHVPLAVVVLNNNSLGMIRRLQLERGDKSSVMSSLYLGTDYASLARAMGARGETIPENAEIVTALNRAFEGTLPAVIDCKIPINTGIQEK